MAQRTGSSNILASFSDNYIMPNLKISSISRQQHYTYSLTMGNIFLLLEMAAKPDVLITSLLLQILMYKTAVYMLVNGVITHQKQQISKKVILLSSTLTLRQCHAA